MKEHSNVTKEDQAEAQSLCAKAGNALFGQKDESAALALLDQAFEHNPYYAGIYRMRALIAFRKRESQEALSILNQARDLGIEEWNTLVVRARVLADIGVREELLPLVKRLFEWDTSSGFEFGSTWAFAEFNAYREDPEFTMFAPGPMPSDQDLRRIYQAFVENEAYEVVEKGQEALPSATDQIAVLEPVLAALEVIVSDLDEHGEENLWKYGDEEFPIEFFSALKDKLEAQLRGLVEKGAQSSVFSSFMRNRNPLE